MALLLLDLEHKELLETELICKLFFVFLHQALRYLISCQLRLIKHGAVVRAVVPKVRQEELGGNFASFDVVERFICVLEHRYVLFDYILETKLGLLVVSFR